MGGFHGHAIASPSCARVRFINGIVSILLDSRSTYGIGLGLGWMRWDEMGWNKGGMGLIYFMDSIGCRLRLVG